MFAYTGYCFSAAFHHICRFTASSDVRFFHCFTLFTSVTHFISGIPILVSLPMTRFSILVGRYLSFSPFQPHDGSILVIPENSSVESAFFFWIFSLYFQNDYAGGNIIASHNRFENASIFYFSLFNSVVKWLFLGEKNLPIHINNMCSYICLHAQNRDIFSVNTVISIRILFILRIVFFHKSVVYCLLGINVLL